jgi:hypothetical protein
LLKLGIEKGSGKEENFSYGGHVLIEIRNGMGGGCRDAAGQR